MIIHVFYKNTRFLYVVRVPNARSFLEEISSSDNGVNRSRYLQDAPSVSSKEDVAGLEAFVTKKLSGFYEAEQNLERRTSITCLPDARVDVCLFLLEPHLLPEVDIDAIVAIGKKLPIVLLLAKVGPRACIIKNEPDRFYGCPCTCMLPFDRVLKAGLEISLKA